LGWKLVEDIGEGSIFYKGDCVCAVFTDDFTVGGPEPNATTEYDLLHGKLGFSPKSYENREKTNVIGLQRVELEAPDGMRKFLIHQADYIRYVVDKFEKMHKVKLTIFNTPGKPKPDAKDLEKMQLPGKFKNFAPKHVGEGYWIFRGTRPEGTHAVQLLAQHLTDWSEYDDDSLLRLFGYLKGTIELGLVYSMDFSEAKNRELKQINKTDSDLAGDPRSTKSTSGWITSIEGRRSQCTLDWGARKQGFTALNTADSELGAAADGICRSHAPVSCMLEQVWGYHMHEEQYVDNEAAEIILASGTTKKLAYLRRTQRVSIGALSDYVNDPEVELFGIATDDNTSDIMTKGLDYNKHWTHCKGLGLG
jgi:hypothetical protein